MSELSRNRELRAKERQLVPIPARGEHSVVVAYPNRYWLGMSNLGFQTVIRLFAEQQTFGIERAFLPEEDFSRLQTFESSRSVRDADIFALSLSFETDYPYALWMLGEVGVGAARDGNSETFEWPDRPLVIGGGAALTLNPEPLADFFDLIVIGEAEENLAQISQIFQKHKRTTRDAEVLLLELAQLPGVYVPRFYQPKYSAAGQLLGYCADPRVPARPMRAFVEQIDSSRAFTVIQTPETEFKSMFMTETGRGCEVGCKFCVAGYMYRPTRKRSAENLRETLKLGLESSESVGFVGAAVSSHPKISELASEVAQSGRRAALSSIMSQRVSRELAASLSESEYKTVALAPEAGSEELRFKIGKRVLDDQFVRAVETLAEHGIRNFKLYFIVGLPGEREEDVAAIVELVRRARNAALAAARRQPDFSVAPHLWLSVNPFIPKAWTPFQRHEFPDFKEVKRKLQLVKKGVATIPNVEMKFESPRESYFQALMSRGDRRVGQILQWMRAENADWRTLVRRGEDVLVEGVPPADYFVRRRFTADECLPWEVVDLRIKRTLLERLYQETFSMDVSAAISRRRHEFENEVGAQES